MNISIENTSALGRRLTVSLPNDKLVKEVESRFTKLNQTASLKGFRKGKVPPKLLKEKFGSSVRMEAIEELVRDSLHHIIQDKNLNIAGRPAIEKITDLPEKELEYVASFEIYPEIVLADLSSVDFEKTVVNISGQDVDSMIEKLKDRFCDWEEVDRKTELTDKLTMDFGYQLEADKKAGIEPQIKKNAIIILGLEGIVPGLTEALVGKQKGDEVTTDLVYPEAWDDKTYAGKTVSIKAIIHKIEAKKPLSEELLIEKLMIEEPEPETEEGKTKADKLKEMVREKMQMEVTDKLYAEVKEKVLELLIENNPLELPVTLVQQEFQALTQEIANNVHQGVKAGESSEAELKEMAEKRVLLGLLVREYVQKKNLKINPTSVTQEIMKVARAYPHISPDQVIQAYYSDKRLLDSVERMVLLDEAVNAMLEELKVKEVNRSFEEVMKTA